MPNQALHRSRLACHALCLRKGRASLVRAGELRRFAAQKAHRSWEG